MRAVHLANIILNDKAIDWFWIGLEFRYCPGEL